jgi:hypothetical protein
MSMENTELTTLPVLECIQVPVIVQNLMDMAASYQAKKDYIATLPRDDEGMKEVKALRAEARKEFEELDEKRKEVKRKVLDPYNKAETIFKSFVTTPFNALDKACKEFSDGVEGEMKARCENELREYFSELCAVKGIHWLPWEKLGIKVDMATARLKEPKKAMETIKTKVEKVCADLDTISRDFKGDSAEYLAEYESCLDVSEASRRVNARKEAQRIAEENRAQREARQAQAAVTRQAMPEVGTVVVPQQEKKFRVTFTVTATMPMLRAMKAWLEDKKIEYQEAT